MQAGEHIGFFFRLVVILGFINEKQYHQRSYNDQHRTHPKGEVGAEFVKCATGLQGDNGTDPAHKVNNAVGLGAFIRRGDVWHECHHWRPPNGHTQNERTRAGYKEWQDAGQWNQPKGNCADRRADQDERQPSPDFCPQSVRPGPNRWLDEQCRDIIERHEETDPDGCQVKLVGQKNRHERVIYTPNNAYAEKTKTKQENPGIIKLHRTSPPP